MNDYCLHPRVLFTIFTFHLEVKGRALRINTRNLHLARPVQPKWPFIILTVSLEGINCTSMTAQAISKVLSAKISHYTVSAPIGISSLPGHDVPVEEMRLAKTEPAGTLVVLQVLLYLWGARGRRCGWFTLHSPVLLSTTTNQIHLRWPQCHAITRRWPVPAMTMLLEEIAMTILSLPSHFSFLALNSDVCIISKRKTLTRSRLSM